MPDRIFNMQHRYARIFQPLSESGILISEMKRFVKTDTQKKLSRNKKVHTYKVLIRMLTTFGSRLRFHLRSVFIAQKGVPLLRITKATANHLSARILEV